MTAPIDRRSILLGGAGLMATTLPDAMAQTPESAKIGAAAFFKRQPLSLVVAAPKGGSYDGVARSLAPHLERRLGTKVIVENEAGGASTVLARLLRQSDNSVAMAMVNAESVLVRRLLVAAPKHEVSNPQVQWLAGLSPAAKIWFVGRQSSLRSVRDAMAAGPLTWPAVARADTISDAIGIMCSAAGIRSKVKLGYKSASEIADAVIAGQADCALLPADAAVPLVTSGKVRALAVFSKARLNRLPELPTIAEALPGGLERRPMLEARLGLSDFGMSLAAAADIPAYRVGYLRLAIMDVLRNKAFIKDAQRLRHALEPIAGADMQRDVDSLIKQIGEWIVEFRKAANDGVS